MSTQPPEPPTPWTPTDPAPRRSDAAHPSPTAVPPPARIRSWAFALILALSTMVGSLFASPSMMWPASQSLCADVAVTVAVNPDHGPPADFLYYRITAGHSHGPPTAVDESRSNRQTYYVLAGDTPVLVHNCGGVYSLRDEDGNIVRTGRTNDLSRRQAEHANDPTFGKFEFTVEHRTNSYAEQRGLEQMLYDANPQAMKVNGGFNKIRPVSPLNPLRPLYMRAAQNFLDRLA